jgi:hypothetical protein
LLIERVGVAAISSVCSSLHRSGDIWPWTRRSLPPRALPLPLHHHGFMQLFLSLQLTAQLFFAHYHHKQETFYEEELLRLKSITTPAQMIKNDLFETFRCVCVGMCVWGVGVCVWGVCVGWVGMDSPHNII